jgi:hypothetical protein
LIGPAEQFALTGIANGRVRRARDGYHRKRAQRGDNHGWRH